MTERRSQPLQPAATAPHQGADALREALRMAKEALESCDDGDYSTGHVIHPSFDSKRVDAALEAIDAALTSPAPGAAPHQDNQLSAESNHE